MATPRHDQPALVRSRRPPYLCAHARIPVLLLVLGLAVSPCLGLPASAQTSKTKPAHTAAPAGPKAIGKFDDWTAATNKEAGQTVCYAFTRAQSSAPAVPGRGDVVLTVTERPGGRDAVAISAGFAYAANAAVAVHGRPAASAGLLHRAALRLRPRRPRGRAGVPEGQAGGGALAGAEGDPGDGHVQPQGLQRRLRRHRQGVPGRKSP